MTLKLATYRGVKVRALKKRAGDDCLVPSRTAPTGKLDNGLLYAVYYDAKDPAEWMPCLYSENTDDMYLVSGSTLMTLWEMRAWDRIPWMVANEKL